MHIACYVSAFPQSVSTSLQHPFLWSTWLLIWPLQSKIHWWSGDRSSRRSRFTASCSGYVPAATLRAPTWQLCANSWKARHIVEVHSKHVEQSPSGRGRMCWLRTGSAVSASRHVRARHSSNGTKSQRALACRRFITTAAKAFNREGVPAKYRPSREKPERTKEHFLYYQIRLRLTPMPAHAMRQRPWTQYLYGLYEERELG